jgi:hypothetical protein
MPFPIPNPRLLEATIRKRGRKKWKHGKKGGQENEN